MAQPDHYTQYGINEHFHDHDCLYRMERAIIDDNWTALLQWLTRVGGTFNACDANRCTPLHFAVLHQREKIAQNLIKGGAFINARTIDGYTPLMLAVRLLNISMARLMILYGADVNIQCINGVSALALAIANRHEGLVHMLLDHHADPRGGYPTPHLHRALWMGPDDVADTIWRAGASPEQLDAHGRTAMYVAASYGRTNILLRMLPNASATCLLKTWRTSKNNTYIDREIRRRVRGLDTHVKESLDAWKLPRDIEQLVLEYLYKSPPQHNVSHQAIKKGTA